MPEDVVVTLGSSAPGVVLPDATVTVLAGWTYAYFTMEGQGVGTAVITASAPGYLATDTITVSGVTPELILSSVPATVGFDAVPFVVYTGTAAGVQNAAHDIALTLSSNDTDVIGVQATATVPAGLSYAYPVFVWGAGSGTADFDASAVDFYGTTSEGITVDVSDAGLSLLLGEELLTYMAGAVATASSEYDVAWSAQAAADHSRSTSWVSNWSAAGEPAWWKLALPQDVAVRGIYYWPRPDDTTYNPPSGTFALYDGDPDAGGALIATTTVALPTTAAGAGTWVDLVGTGVRAVRFLGPTSPAPDLVQVGEIAVVGTR